MNHNPISSQARASTRWLTVEMRRREAASASLLVPGSKTWLEALDGMSKKLSSTKAHPATFRAAETRARLIRLADERLTGVDPKDLAFYRIGQSCKTRRAALIMLTLSVDDHPLEAVNHREPGLVSRMVMIQTSKNVYHRIVTDAAVAFMPWHAMGRLFEHGHRVTIDEGSTIFQLSSIAGWLLRHSPAHAQSQIHLALERVLVSGHIKHGSRDDSGGTAPFFDIATVLPLYNLDDADPRVQQGRAVTHAVHSFLASHSLDLSMIKELAHTVPALPWDGRDYASRATLENPAFRRAPPGFA